MVALSQDNQESAHFARQVGYSSFFEILLHHWNLLPYSYILSY